MSELAEVGISANAFAQALHVPANRITAILNGSRSITADTSLRISRFFDTTPEFWLNLQTAYHLKIARQTVGNRIEQEGLMGSGLTFLLFATPLLAECRSLVPTGMNRTSTRTLLDIQLLLRTDAFRIKSSTSYFGSSRR